MLVSGKDQLSSPSIGSLLRKMPLEFQKIYAIHLEPFEPIHEEYYIFRMINIVFNSRTITIADRQIMCNLVTVNVQQFQIPTRLCRN